MAGELTGSSFSTDQEKFLAAKLIKRSYLKLVMGSLCDKVQQPEGAGLAAYFVRYKRMNVPLTPLADDGADPTNSSFTLDQQTVTLDEWGDVVTITNVAQLTTKHPLIQQAISVLADNAARVMDREITIVMLANTNVQYGTGAASRTTLGTSDIISNITMNKARINFVNAGAPPRGSGGQDATQIEAKGQVFNSAYVAVCGPEVIGDIMAPGTSLGTWAAAATYANAKSLYSAEVGTWLNIRWVETNFIPRFRILGSTTTAVSSAAAFGTDTPVVTAVDGGGSLTSSTTYYFKVTRKDLLRGFEEDISIEHTMASTATGNNESFTFNFSSLTAGYVYNLYFGSATGDVNLKQYATTNIAVGTTVTVASVPSTTITPPASNATTVTTVYPIFLVADEAMNWVGFFGIRTYITKDESIVGNVLRRRRSLGWSFFGKAMVRDSTRLLRIEVASTY
jgi:N4-gp56 family major capsid protein